MEPIVSDGRTRLRLWKTMTSRFPPEVCVARLKDTTAAALAMRADQPIGRLTGKDWAIVWKRGHGRNKPVRALFLKMHQQGMGSAITYAPVISPYIAFVLAVFMVIFIFNAGIWNLTFAGVMAGFIALYLLAGFVFSRKEGEMLVDFARRTMQAHEGRS